MRRRCVTLACVIWACSCGITGKVPLWVALRIPYVAPAGAATPRVDRQYARNFIADWNHLGGDQIQTMGCVLVPATRKHFGVEDCVARFTVKKNGRTECVALQLFPAYDNPENAIVAASQIDCTHIPKPGGRKKFTA